MQNAQTTINLREIPPTCFFQKLESGWVHFNRLADEPGEGADDYCWIEGHYLDAADYEAMLPSTPIIRSDLQDAGVPVVQMVPLRISAGKVKGKKNAHCENMIDRVSILHREWFYMLKNGGQNATWAEGRLDALSNPDRPSPLKLPFDFTALHRLSQIKVPLYTPFKRTADFNKAVREKGAKLKQPAAENSDLMDWEKPYFTLINLLMKAHICAYKFSHGITDVGHDIRERLANKSRGKRKTAYPFSSETVTARMVGEGAEFSFTLDEKITLAHVTAINPADFILPDECRRHYYELLILTSAAADGKPVKQITESAVRLLIKWHDNIPTDDMEDDIQFLTEIWGLLFRKPLAYKIGPMHIRLIASALNIPGLWQYLRQQAPATN